MWDGITQRKEKLFNIASMMDNVSLQNSGNNTGERIRSLRKESGMTQVELATEIGISRSHLTKIETGADLPSREILMAVSTYFNVSLDWITKGISADNGLNTKEKLLLAAFRKIPEDEADAYLHLLLKRSEIAENSKIEKK
ncbi:helix-turn-helix protein [Entomobacter blattae]|uniref:Helix-turn-helix protein n=2 Tax=Entomobacter blattae TaxID=2762277 RepID=A0A7H1NUE4_9PROT|nr:helix-turn-helix protein [Entomobacter blattae]